MEEIEFRTKPSGSTVVKGALVLGAAAVISKLLGTLQKIPLQNIAGDGTYGIYSTVYPYYVLILFLATAGFPVAVSKFVAERMARDDLAGAKRVLLVATVCLSATGFAAFSLLYFGAEAIARFIDNSLTVSSIRSASWALLIVPFMSVLRGYFQGQQNMMPTGISQVVEQLVRVATMLFLLFYFTSLQYSDSTIAAGQTFGAVTGAMAGLVVMLIYGYGEIRKHGRSRPLARSKERYIPLAGQLMLYALPICLGAVVVPILNIVDTFTMPRLLKSSGMNEAETMRQIGIYSRGLTLVQLVAMIASSIAVAIVPAIAAAKMKQQWPAIRVRAELLIRFTWLIGLAASVGLAVLALPINVMLYKDSAGTWTVALLGCSAVFSVLNIITASVLQGMGRVFAPALNLIIAALLKIGLNIWLIPMFSIVGSALAGVVAFVAAAGLNVIVICRMTNIRLQPFLYLLRPGAALIVMTLVLLAIIFGGGHVLAWLTPTIPYRIEQALIALIAILIGAIVYIVLLLRFRSVAAADLRLLSGFGSRLIPKLVKWRLIREETLKRGGMKR